MKINDQVCSWEQGKRLKELGIEQKSYFYHTVLEHIIHVDYLCVNPDDRMDVIGSAFNVAELAVMLPIHYPSWRFPVPGKGKDMWIATVICEPKPPGLDDIHTAHEFDRMADTQAQALATLLIALLVTEAITPEEVNDRLKA